MTLLIFGLIEKDMGWLRSESNNKNNLMSQGFKYNGPLFWVTRTNTRSGYSNVNPVLSYSN